MTDASYEDAPRQFTAFAGERLIASGPLAAVLPAARTASETPLMIFADDNGDQIEPDWRLADADIIARLSPEAAPADKRVGRPKLGVVAREVTLLPRHWDWLSSQPGGASAALRKLVDQARRDSVGADRVRRSQRAVDRFIYRMGGDLPQFEEAYRALYAQDFVTLDRLIATWPTDIRDHLRRLVASFARDLDLGSLAKSGG